MHPGISKEGRLKAEKKPTMAGRFQLCTIDHPLAFLSKFTN